MVIIRAGTVNHLKWHFTGHEDTSGFSYGVAINNRKSAVFKIMKFIYFKIRCYSEGLTLVNGIWNRQIKYCRGQDTYCSFSFSVELWEECLGYVLVVIVTELTSWQDFVIKIGLKNANYSCFNLFPVRYLRKIILQIASHSICDYDNLQTILKLHAWLSRVCVNCLKEDIWI